MSDGFPSSIKLDDSDPDRRLLLLRQVVFLLSMLWIAIVAAHHEPWRDEADAWLMARDAPLLRIFGLASFSGTPALWYLTVRALVLLSLPYVALTGFSVILGLISIWLVLFRLKLPPLIACGAVAGFHLAYQYSVIARNYSLGVPLFFLAISLDRGRERKSLLYGAIIALLANTGAHFLVLAVALMVTWTMDLPIRQRPWKGMAVGFLGIAVSVLQLYPRPGGQFSAQFFPDIRFSTIESVLATLFGPEYGYDFEWIGSTVFLVLLFASLLNSRRAATFFILSVTGLLYIFVCKYFAGTRHSGLVLVGALGAISLADHSIRKGPGLHVTKVMLVILFAMLGLSSYKAINAGIADINKPFSDSYEMSVFMRRAALEDREVAAHYAPHCASVLPYLKTRTFYYPGSKRSGTYMLWDSEYARGNRTSVVKAFERAKGFYSEKGGPPFLFLTSIEFEQATEYGYKLLYKTEGRPIHTDEVFYLYGP